MSRAARLMCDQLCATSSCDRTSHERVESRAKRHNPSDQDCEERFQNLAWGRFRQTVISDPERRHHQRSSGFSPQLAPRQTTWCDRSRIGFQHKIVRRFPKSNMGGDFGKRSFLFLNVDIINVLQGSLRSWHHVRPRGDIGRGSGSNTLPGL